MGLGAISELNRTFTGLKYLGVYHKSFRRTPCEIESILWSGTTLAGVGFGVYAHDGLMLSCSCRYALISSCSFGVVTCFRV
jgi:hypothetical protein